MGRRGSHVAHLLCAARERFGRLCASYWQSDPISKHNDAVFELPAAVLPHRRMDNFGLEGCTGTLRNAPGGCTGKRRIHCARSVSSGSLPSPTATSGRRSRCAFTDDCLVSAVINSSGLETATAFAAWCGGLCVVERSTVPPALILWTSISFVALILSRPISPLNAAIIAFVLCAFAGWRRIRTLFRDKSIRPLLVSMVGGCAIAAAFLAFGGVPVLTGVVTKPMSLLIASGLHCEPRQVDCASASACLGLSTPRHPPGS